MKKERGSEAFREYVHDKIIMANKVPIDDREIIPYLLQGMPDPQLRDQARLLKLRTKADLLEVFEDVTLRGPVYSRTPNAVRDYGRSYQHHQPSSGKNEEDKGRNLKPGYKQRFCHNCGVADHMGYIIIVQREVWVQSVLIIMREDILQRVALKNKNLQNKRVLFLRYLSKNA